MNTAIVRHKKTNILYRHLEGNKFRNLATGAEGEVSDEVAQRIFAISTDATELINQYPQIENLIKALNLKIEQNEQEK